MNLCMVCGVRRTAACDQHTPRTMALSAAVLPRPEPVANPAESLRT